MIHLIPLHQIDAVWPLVAPGMAKAAIRAHSNRSVAELFVDCRCGTKLLYIIEHDGRAEAALIARVVGDLMIWVAICKIEGAPARIREWMRDLVDYDWRGKLGVTRIHGDGRIGFVRVTPRVKVIRQVYELRLD